LFLLIKHSYGILLIEPISELKTVSLNLEFGIINEFLIMENSSEIRIDLRINWFWDELINLLRNYTLWIMLLRN